MLYNKAPPLSPAPAACEAAAREPARPWAEWQGLFVLSRENNNDNNNNNDNEYQYHQSYVHD